MAFEQRQVEMIRLTDYTPYEAGVELQLQRRTAIQAGEAGNALFLLEHPPVLTMGREFHPEHLLRTPEELEAHGIALAKTGRGGDITYHGPGQLVAYPILDLQHWTRSIRWYLRSLEQVIIDTLGEYGIPGERVEGLTGVWTPQGKIAQVGIGIHRWVTYHGIAINVDPNMDHFTHIVPCGIHDKPVTSMARILGEAPPVSHVMDTFEACFCASFVHAGASPAGS